MRQSRTGPAAARRVRLFLGLALGVCAAPGCVTATRHPPDAPSLDEVRAAASEPRPTIWVDDSKSERAATELAETLRETALFSQVYVDESYGARTADFVVTPPHPLFWDYSVPVWTVLSLGLIPSFEYGHPGHSFTMVDARSGANIHVSATYRSARVLGWLAVPIGLFPGWTFGDSPPGDTPLRLLADRLQRAFEQAEQSRALLDEGG